MVEILCPHCEEEIELDDDTSGEFACPHCDGEFEWNVNPKPNRSKRRGSSSSALKEESSGPSFSASGLKVAREAVHIAMFAFLVLCLTGPTMYVVETEEGAAVADYSTTTFKTHSDDEYESFDTEYSEVMDSLKALKEACVFAGGGGCELFDEAMSGFGRWNLASNIYTFMVGVSAVLVGLSFAARGLVGLVAGGRMVTSAVGFERLYGFGRFAIVPAGGLWLLATILFIFITPSFEATYSFAYDFAEGPEVNTSYTLFVWLSLLMSVALTVGAVMFLSNIPLELREPVENPLYLASLVALVSSALCGVGLLASYFFNWLIAGEIFGLRPLGIHLNFFGAGETLDWIEIFQTEGMKFIAVLGMLFFLLVLASVIVQLAHTVSAVAVQLDDMGVIDMTAERYNLAVQIQVPSAAIALGGVVASYLLVQVASLLLLSDQFTGFFLGDSIPRPSLVLVLLIVGLVVQFLSNQAYREER
jgi:hypothetical protein